MAISSKINIDVRYGFEPQRGDPREADDQTSARELAAMFGGDDCDDEVGGQNCKAALDWWRKQCFLISVSVQQRV
jgi:hypothetical protein